VASALGLLIAPARVDRSMTLGRQLKDTRPDELEAAFDALEAEAAQVITETLAPGIEFSFERYADIRFVGQGFDIVTRLPGGPFDASTPSRIQGDFETAYTRVFGQVPPVQDIELINLRVSAQEEARNQDLALASSPNEQWQIGASVRSVWHEEAAQYLELPVLARESMRIDEVLQGPVVVEDASSTLLVPGAATVVRDGAGNLIIDLQDE
jgi:N-methylhydantoinase A